MDMIFIIERKIELNLLNNILVCVTQQKTCERLILKASNIKEESKGDIFIIHVAKEGLNFLDNPKEGEALQYLFQISKSVGANLTVLKSDNIIKCIASFAKDNNISCIILGESLEKSEDNIFYKNLKKILPNVIIEIVP